MECEGVKIRVSGHVVGLTRYTNNTGDFKAVPHCYTDYIFSDNVELWNGEVATHIRGEVMTTNSATHIRGEVTCLNWSSMRLEKFQFFFNFSFIIKLLPTITNH
jgi:hypothetical protein